MRIVDLKTFRGVPENTLFSKYEPYVFGPLEIKGHTWPGDFLTQQLHSSVEVDLHEHAALDMALEFGG